MKYAGWRILSRTRPVYTGRFLLTDPPFPNAKSMEMQKRLVKASRFFTEGVLEVLSSWNLEEVIGAIKLLQKSSGQKPGAFCFVIIFCVLMLTMITAIYVTLRSSFTI